MDRQCTASKLEVYRGMMRQYAAKNDFSSAAELQKVVAYLQKRMTADALDGTDELSLVGKISPELGKQMKTIRDEMEEKGLNDKKKMDKMYKNNLIKLQKKYARLQQFDEVMEIQQEIAAIRSEDKVSPFIGQWKTIAGTGTSQNEILSLNKDHSAILTGKGQEFSRIGYKSFRISSRKNSVDLLGANGKVINVLTLDSKGEAHTPDGWGLRKVDS